MNNAVDAPDKTVTVSATVSGGNGVADPGDATLTLSDDDGPPTGIALTLTDASGTALSEVAEDAGATTVTVTATATGGMAFAADTDVTISVTGSGAAAAVDFDTVSDFTIAFSAGAASAEGTFTLTPTDDAVHETDETVTVSGESGTLTIPDATLTLEDDEDLPTLTLALDPGSIGENGGVATVTASLSGASSSATAVTVTAAPDAGAVATDFTLTGSTLTIAAGDTDSTGTVTIAGVDNAVDAPDKTVTVSGSASGGNGVADPGDATLTLSDDDGPPTGIALTLTDASGTALSEVAEDAGATTVTVTATATGGMAFAADTDVTISVTGSGAAAAVDFDTVSDFTIAFSAGAASAEGTFTLTPTDDAVHETDETVTVSGESGTLTIPDATLTLEDDEDLPTLTLALDPGSIGENGGVATVTASLSGASSSATAVTVTAAPDAGAVATDFTLTGSTLTIAAGDTDSTGTVTIAGVDNAVDAPDKTVTVSGSASGGNGVADPGDATLTLSDDDGPPTGIALTLTDASGTALSEVAEDAGATTVTVTATATGGMAFAADTDVTISVTGSGAAAAVDFDTVSDFTIAFSAGAASAEGTFTLTPTDDAVHETDETVTVSGESGTLTIPDATLTLEDDEDLPTLTLALDPGSIGENGGVATVTASLSGASSSATAVTVTAAPDAGAVATDFTLTGSTLTIAAGDTDSTGTVTIAGVDNAVDAPDKTVTVSGSASGGNGVADPGDATLTLSDDDGPPTGIALTLTDASGTALSEVAEDAGATTVTVTATATGGMAFAADTDVTISVTGSGAAAAVDFDTVSDFTIAFSAGAASAEGTFTLTPTDDAVHETDETVTVSGESGTLTIPDATLTLEDDEDLPTLTLALDPGSIGEAGGVATVTASLSGASSAATAVTVSAAPNAGAVATDFTVSTNKTLTIAAGDTDSTGTVTIAGVDNAVDAPDKTVTVSATVSGGNGVAVPGTATLTLSDDDGPPTGIALTLSDASGTALSEVAENAGATTVTVTATATGGMAFAADTDVTISVTGSLAATAVAFAAVSDFTIAFSAGAASAEGTFTLTPTDDAVHETDETVTVSGESGTLTIPDATLTLEDDEDLPTLTLALDNSSIGEAGGVAAVTASLSGASSAATAVTVSAAPNAGAVATDFTVSTNKTLTIAAGDTDSTGTVTIAGVNNAVDAPDKTVTVSATVSGGNGVADPGDATLTLSDDDGPPTGIALTLTDASATALSEVAEDAGATTVTVTATATGGMAFAADTDVTISVTGSLAATAVAFAAVSDFTIAFSAGAASAEGTFTLTPTDDAVHETDETVTVSGESGTLTIPDATLTLEDDEDLPTLTLALDPGSIGEAGGVAAVTASLSGASSAATAVTVTAAPDAGAVATDFTLTGSTLTIAAGDTDSTGTVTIAGVDNAVDAPDKTVTVSGSASGGNGVADPGDATLTLSDDDGPPTGIALTLSDASGTALSEVAENAGATTVTVTATATGGMAFAADTDVTISVAGSGAAAAVDFDTVSDFTIAFSAGAASAEGTFTLTPTDDAVHETDETVTVSGESGTLTIPDATLTLEDDEDLPTLTLALDNSSIGEAGGVAAVTASLSGASSAATAVTVSAAPNAGAVATDFTVSTNKTLTIAAGDTDSTGTVTIAGVNNAVDAPDKTVTVSATVSGGNGVADPGTATLTLSDDDGPPTGIALTLSDASGTALSEVAENAGATTVTVTATATGGMAFAADTDVTISVTGSGAAAAVDFDTVSDFTIAFSAGAASAEGTFTLTPTDDAVHETDETVTVSGESGTLTIPDATLTLEDDEDLPTLTLALDNSSIGEAGGVAAVTASLSGASSAATAVTVSAAPNAGAVATDFTVSTNKTLTIAAGDTDSTGTVTIAGVNNAVDAPDKTVTVSATVSGGNGVAVPGTATLTLSDDDGPPTGIALTLSDASGTALSEVAENAGATTVTVTATPTGGMAFAADTDVTISVTGSLAATAVAFAAVSDFTIAFSAGAASAEGTFTLTPTDDAVHETDETVTVSGESGTLTIPDATLTLEDDEDLPTLTLALDNSSIGENGGVATVTASLSGASSAATAVTVSAAPDAGAVATDFTLTGSTLTIAAGDTDSTGTVTIAGVDNAVDAPDKTVTVSATVSGGNGVADPGTATLTLSDDDGPPTPAAPANFAATAGDARVTLTWDTADDDSILRWEYRQKEGTGSYGAWTTIADSGPGTTAYAVVPLVNDTAYTFRIRAVNAVGNGPVSEERTATPRAGNNPPTVATPLADRTLLVGETLEVDVSAAFDDHDDDELTYTAVSDEPAAASVTLSEATLTLTGAAPGTATVTVTASDGEDSASDVFTVTVEADTQPSFATGIPDRTYTRGVEIVALTMPLASGGNGELTYSLSPAPPSGLLFDPEARTLSGTPTVAQAATAYTYAAVDADGDTAGQSFTIEVRESALSTQPPLAPANFRATAGDARVTLTWDTANDDSILRWEYRQKEGGGGYGDWTVIADSLAGTTAHAVEPLVNGTAYTFQVRAVNAVGNGPASQEVSATPRAGNNPPTVATPIADRTLLVGATLEVDISATFDDHDGDELTYTAVSDPPAALTVALSEATLTLTGTAAGTATVTVTASDGEDSASDVFTVTVEADTQPSFATGIPDRTYTRGDAITTLTLPLASGGNGELSYSLSPTPPAGLVFDPEARTLSGTPTAAQAAAAYTYTAVDADGDEAGQRFTIEVRESALRTEPPLAPANFRATAGDARVTLTWDTANDDSILRWEYRQKEGTIEYGAWTAIDGSLAGTTAHAVDPLVNGTAYTFQVRAVNAAGDGPASQEVSATPRAGNNPPTVAAPIVDRTLTVGATLEVDVSATFDDHDDDELTYTAVSDDPAAATVALADETLTLTGEAAGTATVTVTASDGSDSASDAFTVTVEPDTQPSLAAIANRTYTRGVAIVALTLPLASGGNGALSYSLSPDPPAGLVFDPAARTLSGTPTVAQAASAYTYTATDADGDAAARRFGIEVRASVTATTPLVELKVSFGQAKYTVMEGQQADIAVTMSPAADRRVDVPLAVALLGGTTPEDFSRMPASLVFEQGENRSTISLEVTMDDVNDPGEGIVLSFGNTPAAVSGGEPASTHVHFEQRRMAEQFSQTLEGTLAVIARSTAVSAQTAIEGRFERHRQRNRLITPVGELPPPTPTSDHGAAALRPGESERMGREGAGGRGAEGSSVQRAGSTAQTSATPGSGRNSENRETGTPGSWLRNVALGSLGNRVGSGQRDSGNSVGSSREPVGSVGRQDRQYGSRIGAAAPGSEDVSGLRDRELNLSGVSFEASLGRQEKETSWAPVLWGQGNLQHFNGDLAKLGMDYRGDLEAAHVGLDLYANDRMLAGLSFMRSWGDMEYTDDGTDGVLESDLSTAHPYLYWQPNERVDLWGIAGLGGGDVAVREPGRRHDFDADFWMLAGGVRSVLSRRGNNEWSLRADTFVTQIGTDASEDIAKVSGEAQRSRLMLEWVHDRELSVGRSLSVRAEAGGRIDEGDADRGAGAETGFRLGYLDANSGLDVALHGRVLLVHESAYRDWGVGLQASWDPGEKQRGFRASVMSSWGRDGGGRTTLWDNADAVMRPAEMEAMGIGSQYRLETEVAYAGLKAPGVPGLLTPYSRIRWTGFGRELTMGTAWSLSAALPAMLELEAIGRETLTGPVDLGVFLQASIPLGGSRDVISGRGRVSAQAPDPKSIPRGTAESGADGPRPTAAAVKAPAEPASAAQQDANLPHDPATPEPGSTASQPARTSAQAQGAAPPSITTVPARGKARVVNVQPTPQPRSAASPTRTAELQAQATPPRLEPPRQSPLTATSSDGPAPTVLPNGEMVVQVGAFRSAETAARIADELRQKGHAAIAIGGSDYHRVVVGPFPSRSDAARARSQLEQHGYRGYLRSDLGYLLELARSLSAAPALDL